MREGNVWGRRGKDREKEAPDIYNGQWKRLQALQQQFPVLRRTLGGRKGTCASLFGLPQAKHALVFPTQPHAAPAVVWGLLGLRQTQTVAAATWPGEAEGAPISLLRKWPRKSDRETHLWMLVKVLLLITSKVSKAKGGSWEMES